MIEKIHIKNGGVEDLLNCIKKINEIIELLNAIVVDVDGIKCVDGSKAPAENVLTKSLRMDKEFAEAECVRLQNELERTRKALDVAVDALKDIDNTRSVANHKIGTQDKTLSSGIVFCWTTPDEIHNALEQITALEQKDVKCE